MANEGLTLVRDRWYTALTADVSAGATSLPFVTNVVNGNTLPTPCIVMCGFEQMYATASTATTITVTRGFNSTAAIHAKGATVGIARVAAHHNDVVARLAATNQTGMSYGAGGTTTSTSYATLSGDGPSSELRVDLTTTGGDILAWLTASVNHNPAAGQSIFAAVSLDGAAEAGVQYVTQTSSLFSTPIAVVYRWAGVAAAHIIRGRWKTTAATATRDLSNLVVVEML